MASFEIDPSDRAGKGPATTPPRKRPRSTGARGPHTFRKNPGKRPRKGGSSR